MSHIEQVSEVEYLKKGGKRIVLNLPFTYTSIIKRKLDENSVSILDIGCGNGQIMRIINKEKRLISIGLDIHPPYLIHCRENRTHKSFVLSDARLLPFKEKSIDVVLCSQLIEHLSRRGGLLLINAIERVAKTQVIVGAPVGFLSASEFDSNPFQKHRSSWSPAYFKKKGYSVIGQGLGFVYGENRIYKGGNKLLNLLLYILSYIFSPVVYFFPSLAAQMICIKRIEYSELKN